MKNVVVKKGDAMISSKMTFLNTILPVAPGNTLSRPRYHQWLRGPVRMPIVNILPATKTKSGCVCEFRVTNRDPQWIPVEHRIMVNKLRPTMDPCGTPHHQRRPIMDHRTIVNNPRATVDNGGSLWNTA